MQQTADLNLQESWGEVLQCSGAAVPAAILNYPTGYNNNPDNSGGSDPTPQPPTDPNLPPVNPDGTTDPVEPPAAEPEEQPAEPPARVPKPGDPDYLEMDEDGIPGSGMYLDDEEKELQSGIPKTGDDMMLWLTLAVLAGAVLAAMSAYSRRVRGQSYNEK